MGRANAFPTYRLFDSAVIADPHLIVAQGVARILSRVVKSVRLVASGEELIAAVRASTPGVIVSELKQPGISGISAMRSVHAIAPSVPLIFLAASISPTFAVAAIRAGAKAYLPKSSNGEELLRALETVASGRTYVASSLATKVMPILQGYRSQISTTQLQVLQHLALGLRAQQIADEMGLSVRTIETHKLALMRGFDVHSTLELVRRARAEGLVDG